MPDQPADHAAILGPAAGATGTPDESGVVDVVVLAGGTGRRLGGAVKPDVVARGARLLDHVLAGLERLRDRGLPLGHVCVVARPRWICRRASYGHWRTRRWAGRWPVSPPDWRAWTGAYPPPG